MKYLIGILILTILAILGIYSIVESINILKTIL